MGVQVETERRRKSTKVQSSHCGEGLPIEETSVFRQDLCAGSEDDIHPNGPEHNTKHGPCGVRAGRQDGVPAQCRSVFRKLCEKCKYNISNLITHKLIN